MVCNVRNIFTWGHWLFKYDFREAKFAMAGFFTMCKSQEENQKE